MDLQKLANNNLEYLFYKKSDGPHIFEVSQQYPDDIYVDVTPGERKKIPFGLKLYIAGLSVVGLYIVYRMLQKSSRN